MKAQEMSKYTPGPWVVEEAHPEWVQARKGHYMENVADCDVGPWTDEQHQANARLVAAAPELLEALQGLADRVGVLAAHGRPPAINELELEKAVVAITKAKG